MINLFLCSPLDNLGLVFTTSWSMLFAEYLDSFGDRLYLSN
ncbi:hypothetical protein [Aliterella atlantica]|nr:hypothetical protein [Aliterella atlantica]